MRLTSAGVAVGERCAHGVDRNPRYEARVEEPGDTNPDRLQGERARRRNAGSWPRII